MPRYYELNADELKIVQAYRQANATVKEYLLTHAEETLQDVKEQEEELQNAWIDTLVITEEPSKDTRGKPSTIFYIREKPFRAGYSYQSTALTEYSAKWVIQQLKLR